jgi:hypothetical protein
MEITERLLAVEEIKCLKARYFRLMDTKQWAKWEQLFADDLVAEFPDDQPDGIPFRNRRDFALAIEAANGPARTLHHGHTPEIEILTPISARGVWVMQDWMEWPDGGPFPFGMQKLTGWGHYHETYVKCADGWRIKTLKLTRLHLEKF